MILSIVSFCYASPLWALQSRPPELWAPLPGLVDDVTDDERREEEEAVAGDGALCLNVDLMDGDHLPLGGRGLPHHLQGPQSAIRRDVRDPEWFSCAGELTCNLTVAPMIMLFLRSPMRTMKQSRLFLTAITACRLKISVSARRLD